MEILLLWLPMCFLVAFIGSQKGRSGVGFFFLSFFLSPLIGFLVVLALPSVRPTPVAPVPAPLPATPTAPIGAAAPPARPQKKCVACAELILAEAVKCRYCGTDQPAASPPVPTAAPTMGYCPGCRKLRASTVAKCVYCGDTAAPLTHA